MGRRLNPETFHEVEKTNKITSPVQNNRAIYRYVRVPTWEEGFRVLLTYTRFSRTFFPRLLAVEISLSTLIATSLRCRDGFLFHDLEVDFSFFKVVKLRRARYSCSNDASFSFEIDAPRDVFLSEKVKKEKNPRISLVHKKK